MKRIFFIATMLIAVQAVGQSGGRKVKSGFGVSVVQKQPEFPGGPDSLTAFLNRNINYPVQARLNKIQGRVYIGFAVASTGQIENVRLLSGVNQELDEEAIRVANTFPIWIPGTIDGKPVKTQYVLPIDFVIPSL